MPEGHTDLELEMGESEVALKHLVSASGTFARLIAEVGRAYAGSSTAPLEWYVDVQPGSVKLPMRAESVSTALKPSAIPEIASAVADGLALLDERAERPEFFSDKALEQAKALANLTSAGLPIAVRNGGEKTSLSNRVAANVDDVLGAPLHSYGTVEGKLEGLHLHGARPRFEVYEPLTGHRVECHFTDDVTLDDLRPAIGHRVGIRGEIKARPNGVRVSVKARELRVLRETPDLPGPEDVLGILEDYA